jgi:signal peptidase I
MRDRSPLVIQEPPPQRTRIRRTVVEVLQTVVQMVLLFLLISALIGRFEIHQVSMEPNFHEGQRVIVSKLGSLWSNWFADTAHAADAHKSSPFALQRGQIVVFKLPEPESDALIKRVIGLPGDTISFRDGAVLVNGTPIDEAYVNGAYTSCNSYCEPVTLAADSYFVMGDNRLNSLDSRSFGPISSDEIIGRVVMRYWPLNQVAIYP